MVHLLKSQQASVASVFPLSGAEARSMLLFRQDSNIDQNRKLWDVYADAWAPDAAWVQKMASGSGRDAGALLGDEYPPPVSSIDAYHGLL